MVTSVHIEAVERILTAIYASGDRQLSSFSFGKPGAPLWEGRIGTEIFVRRREYIRALLYIRQNGAPYLRSMSISDLWSRVTSFVTENFWYIGAGEFSRLHDRSYAEQIALSDKIALATALANSALFNPENELTLFPLIPVRVEDRFECDRFFLLKAEELSVEHLPAGIRTADIIPGSFPPCVQWKGRTQITTSWIGVRSPLLPISKKTGAAILGAVSLTPQPRLRYLFSGRELFGGFCTIRQRDFQTALSSDGHTPPMMHDIVLDKSDHVWLGALAALIEARDAASRRRIKALEYYYRAWFLDPRERFPILCMALDSLVGASSRHTTEAVKFVRNVIGSCIDEERLRLLMRVRGAVIHGAAPDVYESENYETYYVNYETDPVKDLELIAAKCLRQDIFNGTLVYHSDPDAKIIEEQRAKGLLPARFDDGCIIPDDI